MLPGSRSSLNVPPGADGGTHSHPSGQGQGRAPRGRWGHVYGALDLGTNNCRLLVAKPAPQGFRVIDAFSRIVRLGEGLARTGRLSEEAIIRALGALKICAGKLEKRGVTRLRAIATEACRSAANGTDFITRVEEETGIALEVISTAEEARLAVQGCLPLIDDGASNALVFDIGGGSTELIWLALGNGRREPEILAWTSLPIGVVTLAERHPDPNCNRAVYEAMIAEVRGLIDPFETEHGFATRMDGHAVQVLGTSGTVTTLAGVHLGLERYDRSKVDGTWMDIETVTGLSLSIATMSHAERASHPCIGTERADLVVAGCAILDGINRTWPTTRLRVADRGLREGMLLSLMEQADRDAVPRNGRRP